MKVIFYVLDFIKTVLRHICMLCEHFRKHDSASIQADEKNQSRDMSAADVKTEKGESK